MTFLAPTALIGVLLLAIPILAHLFKPRKMRQTPFSSLRWLKQTHQRLSRRIQWHQWLLFLMRAGVVLLLVLALARPLIGSRATEHATDRYLILDVGRGMGYEVPGGLAPLAQAQAAAGRLVEQARPGDRTALLLAGAAPRIITGPVADAGPHLPALRAAQVQGAEQPVTAVLPLVRALATRQAAERDVELVFLTSQRRAAWRQDEIQSFARDWPGKARVQVIDAGPGAVHNAWISGARLLELGTADLRVLRAELSCVGEARQERSLRLTGIRDLADDVQSVALAPGQTTRVDFKIPAKLDLTGQIAELRLEPTDALASDDRWFVNLDVSWAVQVLLIEPPDAEPGRGSGMYWRAALDALAESNAQAVRSVSQSSKVVTAADVRQADLIVLAGVPDLPAAVLEAIEQRVRAGAGAVVFLGEGLQTAFYQNQMHRPLQPVEGLLPAALHAEKPWRIAEAGELTGLRWEHPLLAVLRDPVLSDLQQARFRKHAGWAGAPGTGDVVLARIDGGEAALIDRPLGAGRVLIWNTSADDVWSDLPRRRAFVPLVDRMLAYLTAGGLRREFVVGEPAVAPLSDAGAADSAQVTSPSGVKLTPRLIKLGSRTALHLDALGETGAYRVQVGDKTSTFAANVSRAGSPMTALDSKTLQAWWAPAPVEIVSAEAYLQQPSSSGSWPLWPALVLLAGLLLLAETVYVHRLCPRSDPAAVEPVVPNRGVFAPLSKDAAGM